MGRWRRRDHIQPNNTIYNKIHSYIYIYIYTKSSEGVLGEYLHIQTSEGYSVGRGGTTNQAPVALHGGEMPDAEEWRGGEECAEEEEGHSRAALKTLYLRPEKRRKYPERQRGGSTENRTLSQHERE